jgi:biofilm PGA synthesis N-glycosyltransferase PgaC
VIIPAYNEAACIADTIRALQGQTSPPQTILVVDDASDDGTGDVARSYGVQVVRPDVNTGSKAGAQTFGLGFVTTPFVVTVDADTVLALDALEKLINSLAASGSAAACGYVLPRHVRTVWERGRAVEYLFALGFYKRIQNAMGRPLISSGCFSAYRTDAVRAAGGWSSDTMTEDVDLTWTFYARGQSVHFVPEALSLPIEPANWTMLAKQLRRWSHGFVQNLVKHGATVRADARLRAIVTAMLWDSAAATVLYLLIAPILAILVTPWTLLVYVIDVPVVAVPVWIEARRRGLSWRVLLDLPAFLLLRLVNSLFFIEAVWTELIMRRRLAIYEKGH